MNPVCQITGEWRAELCKTWRPGCDPTGAKGGGGGRGGGGQLNYFSLKL